MKKKPDYKGFVLHYDDIINAGFPVSISDMIKWAKMFNCPIPKNIGEI